MPTRGTKKTGEGDLSSGKPAPPGQAAGAALIKAPGPAVANESGGAQLMHSYVHRLLPTVGVTVDDLEDFKSAGREETMQFTVGNFFVAGSFWLGIERIATAPEWPKDYMFWFCVVAFVCGGVVSFFGLRQMLRHEGKIDRIISESKKLAEKI